MTPSLETFSVRLDETLGSLVMSMLMASGLEVPSNSKVNYDSMISAQHWTSTSFAFHTLLQAHRIFRMAVSLFCLSVSW